MVCAQAHMHVLQLVSLHTRLRTHWACRATSSLSSKPDLILHQVLGVGTDTGVTVPSVLLFFDRHRYLFNVGEGFQRFCVDHKVKLSKVGTVLMTRVTTEASGGLPGAWLGG